MCIVRKNVQEFFSFKTWIYIIAFSWQTANLYYQGKDTLTFWEFILAAISDHYYIFYFAVPFLVIALYRQLNVESDCILIRMKKFSNYFLMQIVSVFIISFLYLVIHIFIAILIGCQLNNYQNIFTLKNGWHTELILLSSYFKKPSTAFISSVIYMVLGLTFINIIIFMLNHFFSKKATISIQVIAYLLLIIGLHREVDNVFPWLFLNKYLILHHGLSNSIGFFWSFVGIEIILLIFIYIFFNKFWWKSFQYKKKELTKGIRRLYIKTLFQKKELCIIIVISSLSILFNIIFKSELTLYDLILIQFWGHGTGYFSLIEFINMLIYNGVPIYFLCVFYQNCKTNSNIAVIIRLKNKKCWINEILKVSVLFISLYVIISVVLTICFGCFFQIDTLGYNYMKDIFMIKEIGEPNIYSTILHFVFLKVIELELLYLMIILLDSFINDVATSFILLILGHGLCILPIKYMEYNPIGIAFLSRQYSTTTIKYNYNITYLVLALSTLMAYCLLIHWRREKILEGN